MLVRVKDKIFRSGLDSNERLVNIKSNQSSDQPKSSTTNRPTAVNSNSNSRSSEFTFLSANLDRDVVDIPPYRIPPVVPSDQPGIPSKKGLFSEGVRLCTFRGWPLTFLSPNELAKAGFFFRGQGDQTQCAFCLIVISRWEPSDNPFEEHKRHAPQCPFIRGLPVENIPISTNDAAAALQYQPPSLNSSLNGRNYSMDGTSTSGGSVSSSSTSSATSSPSSLSSTQRDVMMISSSPVSNNIQTDLTRSSSFGGHDECGIYPTGYRSRAFAENESPASYGIKTRHGEVSSLSSFPVQPHSTAGCPTMVTNDSRLSTFKNWPAGLTQKPQQLADAGFFYMGTGDHVKCFWCEGALKNWEQNDEPWVEHARWFTKCKYLLDMKGEEYVKEVLEKFCDEAPVPKTNTGMPALNCINAAVLPKPELYKSMDEPVKNEATLCKVCLDQEMAIVFLPCGHLVACPGCAAALGSCPICRKQIQATVRVYMT